MEGPNIGDRVIVMRWDDETASYMYVLRCYTNDELSGLERWQEIAQGDKEWAKRISEHYNIPIPEKEEYPIG